MNKLDKLLTTTNLCDVIAHYHPLLDDMLKEDRLKLEFSELEDDSQNDRFKLFDNYIRHNQLNLYLDKDVFKIKDTAFNQLYNDAKSLHVDNTQRHVTALKIILGYDHGRISPLFQPVYTKRNTKGEYEIVNFGTVYAYDQNNHVFVPDNTTTVVTNYQSEIRVKHDQENSFNRYIKDKDTTAVIFPFQTIYTLIYDNEIDGDDCIKLVNCLATDDADVFQQKHSIVLIAKMLNTVEIFRNRKAMASFHNKFANRSHLCPPGCDAVTNYIIDKPGPTTCP
jgi:hypothetical protein